jgi:phosphate transport system substrate-binding protein
VKKSIKSFLAAAAVAIAGPAVASGPVTDSPLVVPGRVEWLLPAASEVKPQTDEEKAAGQARGRRLPTPELLQPELDPALQPYVPNRRLKISKAFKVGSSDVLPGLVEVWTDAFRKHHPGFSVEIDKPMAGSLGTLELIKEQVDFVFVSRELKPTDITEFRAKFGYDPISVPISGGTWRHFGFLDSMAFMVHRDNPIESLSFAQLDAIFSATRHLGGRPIRTWGDLGLTGAWATRPIRLYGIKPWNGFEEFIRQKVLSVPGKRGEWRDDMHMDATFFPLARRVAADPGAIGYTGLSAIDSAVKLVPVSARDGGPFLLPTYEAVAGGGYPLARLVYLNANPRPGTGLDPALREFLRFILSREGQAIIRRQGIFLPLRASQAQASTTQIAQ